VINYPMARGVTESYDLLADLLAEMLLALTAQDQHAVAELVALDQLDVERKVERKGDASRIGRWKW
jgi:hypothetical protein